MTGRSAQRIAVLLLVLVAAAALWGCGGGDGADTTSSTAASQSPQTTVPPEPVPADVALIGTEVPATEDTPAAYTEAVAQGIPVVMVFYVPGNYDDAKVLEAVDNLRPEFADYTYLLYDYKTPAAYGDLSTLLQVDYPPETVLVDRSGVIRWIWNGYVDEGTLRQCMVDIGQG
jgi:hypothetical protein